MGDRFVHRTELTADLGDESKCGQIVGNRLEHQAQFSLGLGEAAERAVGSRQRESARSIGRMMAQPGLGHLHSLAELATAAVFLGQPHEKHRRRIREDPASEVVQSTSLVVHAVGDQGSTTKDLDVVAVRLLPSVTVSEMVNVPATA